MRRKLNILKNEKGSAFIVVVWVSLILITLGGTAIFVTVNQVEQTARDKKSLKALNVAEASINNKIEEWVNYAAAGTLSWASIATETVNGSVSDNNGSNVGDYTLSIGADSKGSAYRALNATGTVDGESKHVKILVKAYPKIFEYAVASNNKLEIEVEDDGPVTIVGPIHTNGNLEIKVEDGATVDFSQTSGTYSGSLELEPSDLSVPFVPGPVIDLPQIDINYYRNSANFPDQTVYNIDLNNIPAYLIPYLATNMDEKDDHFEIKIPAEDIAGNLLPWRSGDIINFYWPGEYNAKKMKVVIYSKNNNTTTTLTQTFTAENFKELEFKGSIKLLPLNGQAAIGYNMREIEIKGGVQVGEIGNGALVYAYGRGVDEKGKSKGKIELEDNSTLYGSLIQNLDNNPLFKNPKAEIEEGSFVQFDGAFVDKMGQGMQDQFQNWGNFTLKKVSYKQ